MSMREPLHQPPNPDDLRRVPPGSPDCARVRGWLRDFADGDLEPQFTHAVEEHVHACRVCGLELARAEHEVLRVRRLLQRGAVMASLPADFAARVVERLVVDETSMVSAEALARAAAAAKKAAGAAGKGEDARDGSASRGAVASRLRLRPALALFGAALMVCVLACFGEFVDGGATDPGRSARLVVERAELTHWREQLLGIGDGIGASETMRVDRGGFAMLQLLDATAKNQPAATLSMRGAGALGLDQAGSLNLQGRIDIDTRRMVSIPMADGSRIDLGEGSYSIAAELQASADDPLRRTPEDLLVQVEVKSGEEAAIVRSGHKPTFVKAGQTGIFQGSSNTTVYSGGSRTMRPDGEDRQPVAEVQADTLLFGHVVANIANSAGLADANLLVSYAVDHSIGQDGALTRDSSGRFDVTVRGEITAPFAISLVFPPTHRLDLGVLAPDAYPLLPVGKDRQFAMPFVLEHSHDFYGQVFDEHGIPAAGVQVVPCIVDDVFRTVFPLGSLKVSSDALGNFRCRRMPARLPSKQSLVLLLDHPLLEPLAVPIPERASVVAIEPFPPIQLKRLRTARINELPPLAQITVWEEVRGLPVGSAARRHSYTSNAQGRIPEVQIGSQPMWVQYANETLLLRQLVHDSIAALPSYRPSALVFIEPHQFRALDPLVGDVDVVTSYRHQRTVASQGNGNLELLFVDRTSQPVRGAQVFVVESASPRLAPDARFLGFTTAGGAISLAADQELTHVVAIGADGAFATAVCPAGVSPQRIEMQAPGNVVLHESLHSASGSEQLVAVHFERDEFSLPGPNSKFTRFVCANTNWVVSGISPGQYLVTVGNVQHTITVTPEAFTVFPP